MRSERVCFVLAIVAAATVGCQTETCPPGATDSIFCRNGPDASLDGCVAGAACSPPDDLCASGVMFCEFSGPRCEVTGRLAEGDPCGGGGYACAADGTCSVCAGGALCNTGNPCLGGHVDCGSGAPVCVADTPMDGMTCGTGGVCGGDTCSECIPGLLCNTSNPCNTGHTTCPDPSTTVCMPDTDLPRGVNCGEGLVCSGAGTCDVCSPGTVCNTGNPCVTGHTDCGSGNPVCIADGTVTPGAGCGSGGICSGAGECSECISGTVCNTGNPCTTGVVMCPPAGGSLCSIASNLPAGVRCGVGMACDGAGSCSNCIPADPCVTGTCQTGMIDCSSGAAVCVGSGRPAATGTVCRPSVDLCDRPESCGATGTSCPPDAFAPAGTACIGMGMCNGSGACIPFCEDGRACSTGNLCEVGVEDCSSGSPVCVPAGPMAAGVSCRASVDVCDAEEVCDGSSLTCPSNAAAAAGTTCPAGVCDGAFGCAACVPAAPCMTTNPCEAGEFDCSSGAPVCLPVGPAPMGRTCRPSVGPCDVAEQCTGASTMCPADFFDSTTLCRGPAVECDAPETCNGSGATCPPDGPAAAGTPCSIGVCNGSGACITCTDGTPCSTGRDCEIGQIDCSGGAPVCVAAGLQPAGVSCRVSAGLCDRAETCTGSSPDCPVDAFQAPGTSCRAPTDTCDVAEVCDGATIVCPPNVVAAPGTPCRAAAGLCDSAESCNGVSAACPVDVLQPSGTSCRAAVDLCDQAETCTGSAPTCPVDARRAAGSTCRMAVDVCDQTETCDGSSTSCPANLFSVLGTTCPGGVCDGSGGCSTCAGICPSRPNATTTCSGTCGFTCIAGFDDCNGLVADGCEVDLSSNPLHCMVCGNACPARANASTICSAGSCGYTCNAGFLDCNGNPADGCEVSRNIDVDNCGSCGMSCPVPANSSRTCTAGSCGFSCNVNFGDCNGNPADGCERPLSSDPSNCGFCGFACPNRPNSSPFCLGGACGYSCGGGFADCNAVATDGCEVFLATNVGNCGSCGFACSLANATPACSASACIISTCNGSFYDVDGIASDGCECGEDANPPSCGLAAGLGSIGVGGGTSAAGKIVPVGGADWFTVTFPPLNSPLTFGGGTPSITFSSNPGNEFRFEVYDSCGGPVLGCATNITSWSFVDDQSSGLNAWGTRNVTWPTTVYIHVYRVSGGLSCADYGLAVSR